STLGRDAVGEEEHGNDSAADRKAPVAELGDNTAATAAVPAPEIVAEPAAAPQSTAAPAEEAVKAATPSSRPTYKPGFNRGDLAEALEVVRQMDPPGVACRDLRECLLYQL